tara:strand:- start:933 stop:1934 length:1002 start_codon:yes stop_codon:yes gene_type:complete
MKKIYFLEKSYIFDASNINDNETSGSDRILINIVNELSKYKDFDVKVFNKTTNYKKINNVEWNNLSVLNRSPKADIVIAWSDINLFPNYKCEKYLWSHSVQSIEKFIRKKQLFPFLKHKPKIILEGDYHYNNRSFFTSLFGKEILKVSADYEFINAEVDRNYVPPKNVIFNTRPDRNLNLVLKTWEKIKKSVPKATLYINPPFELTDNLRQMDIHLRSKNSKNDLINELKSMKLMINPGHKGEVFCLVAEEGKAMCVPIVTLGIGSLFERVENNKTGYICDDINNLAEKSIEILNNDDLYLKIKSTLYDRRGSRQYFNVVKDLLKILKLTSNE